MKNKLLFPIIFLLFISLISCTQTEKVSKPVNYKVHTFYYSWFGTTEIDGDHHHWNHPIIPHWRDTTWNNAGSYEGTEDLGANFYPQLGDYSSNDPAIIEKHMEWIREAGIGVLSMSWWGKDSYSDKSMLVYLDLAEKYGLKINIHLEPIFKTAEEFKAILEYVLVKYGNHPAMFKHDGKLLYYVYDSGKVKYSEWNKILGAEGELSIRNSDLDAVVIGHWQRERDGGFILKSGFDGFYTYYASEGFMYGCTSSNWPTLSEFAKEHNLLFIPCPGPGYIDTRIRPWNDRNTEGREKGNYYEQMFMNAVNTNPDYIGITSFNEWHEGTQIEPAVPKSLPNYTYEDYGEGVDPMFYIYKTRELVDRYSK
jgi:glycoprotein endo-alpha-1,2-mannosidase